MREYLTIRGGRPLCGTVRVSGAKNAALPLLTAALLTAEECLLTDVPQLEDISVTLRLLRSLGGEAEIAGSQVRVRMGHRLRSEAPCHLVKMLRSSFLAFGPLLARTGVCQMPPPGGDAIGARPVDIHLRGLAAMGAEIRFENGVVIGTAPGGLRPARIAMAYPSVGATHQLLMTAALVPGETVIENAAREPEVVELARCLTRMGAHVSGAGEPVISIRGQSQLQGSQVRVIGDRIEAATFLCAGAATRGDVTVTGVTPGSLGGVLELLCEAGCTVVEGTEGVRVTAANRLQAVSFETSPFPSVATDVQPLLMAVLTTAEGTSSIRETVFENRFGHVPEFQKAGANIMVSGPLAVIRGVERLRSAEFEAIDIRAAAAVAILAMMAGEESELYDIHHLDRGYERFVEKFATLGANIVRVPVFEGKEVVFGC